MIICTYQHWYMTVHQNKEDKPSARIKRTRKTPLTTLIFMLSKLTFAQWWGVSFCLQWSSHWGSSASLSSHITSTGMPFPDRTGKLPLHLSTVSLHYPSHRLCCLLKVLSFVQMCSFSASLGLIVRSDGPGFLHHSSLRSRRAPKVRANTQ